MDDIHKLYNRVSARLPTMCECGIVSVQYVTKVVNVLGRCRGGLVDMAKCQLCGKKPSFGNNVSHAKNRTRRTWKPNVQKTTMTFGGVQMQVKLCTRCMRTMAKAR
jgi:large subunit ribosomal protein L28